MRYPEEFWVTEAPFIWAGNHIESACQAWGRGLSVGWEKFTIHAKTPAADAHHAIEMIGVARRAALIHGCPILSPAAPGDRNVATMAKLKALGWWVPGKDDAQSAAQHALAWMLRTNNLPPREAGVLATMGD
jgi:hypothetical protein